MTDKIASNIRQGTCALPGWQKGRDGMKDVKRKIAAVFVVTAAICMLNACERSGYEKVSGEYTLYQVAEDGTGLKQSAYDLKTAQDDSVEIVTELLENYKSVDIREFQIKEKQLSLYFSSAYYNVQGIDEVLLRAAIVKTLCQVDGIEYVEFFVENESLNIDGELVGVMSELSFMNSIGGDMEPQEKYVTLYFSDVSGSEMKEVTASLTYDMTVPLARLLVEQLLAGPEEIEDVNTSDVRPTVPDGTRLNSLTIRDNVCYLDLSKEFVNPQAEVKSEIVIYSIVNTLCELSDVNKVQFTIDGEQRQKYGDTKNFDAPFERNLDLVSGASKG